MRNETLLHLELCSCKIGDEGIKPIVAAMGSNHRTSVRRLRVRDNYISAQCGEAIVDFLYHNQSLIGCDFKGNQIDHVRLNKIRAICKRNLAELKDAEPRRLRQEIVRLRLEQQKLKRAESTLAGYQASIARTKADIAAIETKKQEILRVQQERRADLKLQIEKEKAAIAEAQQKVQEKKNQIAAVCTVVTYLPFSEFDRLISVWFVFVCL
jgi:hypothetical protein